MDYSLIIPVWNEVEHIAVLCAEVRQRLEGRLDYELIVVDDGSTDETLSCLMSRQAEDPRLRILMHRERFGQSAALWSGVRAARASWIITLDGDGQNDPADALTLVDALKREAGSPAVDLVAGVRRCRQDSWIKKSSSWIANGARRLLLRDGIRDTGCGLKLIRREAFLDLPFFDHMHRFLPALILRSGGRVVTQEVSHRPRAGGRSKYGVWDRLWVGVPDLLGVWWLKRRAVLPVSREISTEPSGASAARSKE